MQLTDEQIEELCTIAEETARKYVLSKVDSNKIERLNVIVEAEGTKPITITVDVDIGLSQQVKDFDVRRLADEAVKSAFASVEKYMREKACNSTK
jgi:hypothetical protein